MGANVTRRRITDDEYHRLMEEIEVEIEDRWTTANEEQINEEIAVDMILHGWHLAPEATQ